MPDPIKIIRGEIFNDCRGTIHSMNSFRMAFVAPDDWNCPSKSLKPEIHRLSEARSEIICVPEGYANCLRAEEPGSVLMVLSGKRYPERLEDSWRYPPDYWFRWSEV